MVERRRRDGGFCGASRSGGLAGRVLEENNGLSLTCWKIRFFGSSWALGRATGVAFLSTTRSRQCEEARPGLWPGRLGGRDVLQMEEEMGAQDGGQVYLLEKRLRPRRITVRSRVLTEEGAGSDAAPRVCWRGAMKGGRRPDAVFRRNICWCRPGLSLAGGGEVSAGGNRRSVRTPDNG
jgi:hypothetical protein